MALESLGRISEATAAYETAISLPPPGDLARIRLETLEDISGSSDGLP
jgi:hypothetical protein